MQLALIPPICYLEEWDTKTSYHLMLPHLLRDERYALHWRNLIESADHHDDYIILDNGAAEGEEWDPLALQIIADEFEASCIVIPDEYGKMMGTYEKLRQYDEVARVDDIDRMVVLQGTSMQELDALAAYASSKPYVNVLGIPRILISTLGGDEDTRCKVAEHFLGKFKDRFRIHFLGMHPAYPLEWRVIQNTFRGEDRVQGMDTSLPFNAGHMKPPQFLEYPLGGPIVRPDDYFFLDKEEFSDEYVTANCKYMLWGLNNG